MSKEEVKSYLTEYVEEVTKRSKQGGKNQYICPFCNSGTGPNNSGAFTVYPGTNTYHCFACNESGDIFNLYSKINHINDFKVIIEELEKKYNLSKQSKDYTKFFFMAEQHLHETDYLTNRGLSLKTQKKFHCGYIKNFIYKNNQTTDAIIIPTSNTSFAWRSTTENLKRKRGMTHIFNQSALNNKYCFVVEGEIDCMSIDECGFSCIGLGSTSNIRKIFDHDTSKTVLILALDNDKYGSIATTSLAKECDEHKSPYIIAPSDIWGACKDANELLISDKQTLIRNLRTLSEQALALNKEDWLKKILSEPQHTYKNKKPVITYELFSEYIENHGYSIKYNQIAHNFDFFGFDEKSKEHLAETVPIILRNQMKQLYRGVNRFDIIEYITLYATRHIYNPILDLIKATKWDGKDRINQVYDIFKISADTEEGIYNRRYILKAFKQCICGLFNNFDNPFSLDIILIFKGSQGIGKTRFLEKLALNPKYFGEGICLDLHNKDSIIQSTNKWICELGELGSTMRKDIDSLKAFLTKSTDEYRLPYGRASLHYPRVTTFFGTVNDDQFLIDQTGNRRFVTIPLASDLTIDYETQIKPFNALQLWSQIYNLVKDEDKASCFRLTTEDRQYLDKRNIQFVKPINGEDEVLDILEEQQIQEQGYICTFREMTVLQFIQLHNLKYSASTIGKILKKYGYDSKFKKIDGKSTRIINLPYKYFDKSPQS